MKPILNPIHSEILTSLLVGIFKREQQNRTNNKGDSFHADICNSNGLYY
jgi:hypothetical protein